MSLRTSCRLRRGLVLEVEQGVGRRRRRKRRGRRGSRVIVSGLTARTILPATCCRTTRPVLLRLLQGWNDSCAGSSRFDSGHLSVMVHSPPTSPTQLHRLRRVSPFIYNGKPDLQPAAPHQDGYQPTHPPLYGPPLDHPPHKGTSSIISTAPSLPTVNITSPNVFVANPASQYAK